MCRTVFGYPLQEWVCWGGWGVGMTAIYVGWLWWFLAPELGWGWPLVVLGVGR